MPCPSLGRVNVKMVEEQLWFGSPKGDVVLENITEKHIRQMHCLFHTLTNTSRRQFPKPVPVTQQNSSYLCRSWQVDVQDEQTFQVSLHLQYSRCQFMLNSDTTHLIMELDCSFIHEQCPENQVWTLIRVVLSHIQQTIGDCQTSSHCWKYFVRFRRGVMAGQSGQGMTHIITHPRSL